MKATKFGAVFSVYCRTALFGCYELFKPKDIDRFWIDFNYTTKSVSVLCEVAIRNNVRERLSIQIKIDKMQIKNQFDCIVLSIEPATFSQPVSTELNNARVAVFTLPQTEVQRLLRNRDLMDFYNSNKNQSDSEIIAPLSNGTIENFLAEEEPTGDSNADALEDNRGVLQGLTEMVIPEDIPRKQTNATLSSKAVTLQSTAINNPQSKSRLTMESELRPSTLASIATNRPQSKSRLTKESGYGPSTSSSTPIFKVPTNPIRQKLPEKHSTPSRTTKRKKASRPRSPQKSNPAGAQLIQASPTSHTESKRFFKKSERKSADLPRIRPISRPPKKGPSNRNSGVSPKRKQVNTVRPLTHLTQPNCDPQEAALEYVENGGYANIISFIRSSAGAASFNDQQRQQILENVERINDDLDRSSRRFFPEALSSGTDSSDAETTRKHPQKQRRNEGTKFIPFSAWKAQQKQKSYSQATVAPPSHKQPMKNPPPAKCKVKLCAFDQLKGCNENAVTSTQLPAKAAGGSPPRKTLNTKPHSRGSSQSSGSIHNFHIVESDNEMDGSDMEVSPTDMQCRRVPSDMEVTVVTAPNHVERISGKGNSSLQSFQMSEVYSEINETPHGIASDLAKDWASDYQASEVFEDLEDVQTNKGPIGKTHECSFSDKNFDEIQPTAQSASGAGNIPYKQSTVYSVMSTRDENTAVIMPQENNNWYIEKYLKDQQQYNQSPVVLPPPIPSPPRPNIVTTHQVIIQNQFVVSADRKRPSLRPHVESPPSKLSLAVEHLPLRGYAQLLPAYMKRMGAEKERLLTQLKRELEESYFEKITQIANDFQKTTGKYVTEINEVQEQLDSCLVRFEWLIGEKQKKQSQFEGDCTELKRRITSCRSNREEIIRAYEAVELELATLATSTASQLWQGFANNIVTSVENRLRDLVNF